MGNAMKLQYQQLTSWNAVRMGCSFTETPLSCQPGLFFSSISEFLSLSSFFPFPKKQEKIWEWCFLKDIYPHTHTHIYFFFWKLEEIFRHNLSLLCPWKDITHPVMLSFYLLQYPWGQKGTVKVKLLPGIKQCHSNSLIPKKFLQQPICICHHCIYQLPMQMGCDYLHAQLSRLHLQAQHLHTGINLCAGLFVWVLTHCLCLCNFQWIPTSWLMPGLAVEQCFVLPACPHLLRSLHSRGNWKKIEMLSESSHCKHSEVQTAFQTWVKWSMYGKHSGAHQMSLICHCKAWSSDQKHTPHTHPALSHCREPFSSFQASLIQLFITNIFIFQELFIFAQLSIFTVRYAILQHRFTLVICQLSLRAYV